MTWALHSALILIPDKMCLRYLGFVLLAWFAGARHDEKACFAPTILNANYTKNQNDWYEEGYKIRITCDTGYEPKNNDATAVCTNGTWSSVPVCEKSTLACGEPPQIPHAVIIHQGYQEVFAVDSKVQYECEDGYTAEGAENKKSIFCISGDWTEGPTCSRGTGAGTGSTVEGTDRETGPSTRGTSDNGKPSTGGGSSTSSVLNGRDSTPLMTAVDNCGKYPAIPNSIAVKESDYILKYQCNNYYKHNGPETVTCHSDGSWSELPVCKEAFCTLNPGRYIRSFVKLSAVEYIPEGEIKHFPCIGYHYLTSIARCTQRGITLSYSQDATQSCVAPRLDGGLFSPKQDTYSNGTKLTYTCENGRKPAVKGWWASSTCQNGKWSHEPRCIDEKACFAPTILNANYTKNQDGWYEEGNKIRITCDTGYQPKNNDATAVCRNGTWSSVPVCEIHQCGSPPKVLHGVVMEESLRSLTYKCNIYYKLMGPDTVVCYSDGTWSEVPTCAVWFCSVNTDEDPKLIPKGVIYIKYGETVELECKDERVFQNFSVAQCTDGILTVSRYEKACFDPTILNANYTKNQDGWYEEGYKIRITCDTGYEPKNNDATAVCTSGTWSSVPVCEKSTLACGEPPQIPHAVIIQGYQEVFAVDSEVQYKCKDGYTMGEANNKKSIFCISGNWSLGPTCIHQCGSPPKVHNGLVVEKSLRSLTYKCNIYYKLMGPDTVACYSDGTWSEVPTCAVWFCSVNTDEDPKLIPKGVIYLKYGETVELECKDEHSFKNFSVAQCTDGILTVSRCCNRFQINTLYHQEEDAAFGFAPHRLKTNVSLECSGRSYDHTVTHKSFLVFHID
ncbi:Complement factor H [Collichthys lucidus]|uniref:Complement factor H n=1 Tax=Collichthys lucidus TaxID=240159 RepID=A0A4U5UY91_COLLU|nr:Complement factor H [Collichthys lucidus]